MTEVIYMCGANGGAGATTCAVMLGAALAGKGARTLVVDGDFECAAALETCGMTGLSVYTLADVEGGACRVRQAILRHPRLPNLYVLPTLGCENISSCDKALEQCANLFDVIICDKVAIGSCNRAILVCDPYSRSLQPAKKRTADLRDGGFKKTEVLVNKINGGLVFSGAVLTPQEIGSCTGAPIVGVIPEDLSLPLGKIKPATKKAFELTADRLAGKGEKVYSVLKPYTGLAGGIKRRLRDWV